MIKKRNVNQAVFVASKNFARTSSQQDILESGRRDSFAFVVDVASSIDIDTRSVRIRFVVNFSWERIRARISNVIIGHQNDVVFRDTFGFVNLVSVAGISLVSVIAVSVGPSHNDGPMMLRPG